MRQEERFNNILNECLDRVLKGETVEQCLLSYPEQAKELEPLLKTAKAARVISTVQPRPEFKAEARRQFQTALIEMKVKQNERKAHSGRRFQWRWQSGWAIALIVVVIVVLGGGGTVAAAGGSMPDSGLYSVKLAAEQVQLALAPGEVAKTKLNAEFADRRTEEIIYTAKKGNAQEVQVAASRLNTNLSNISGLAAGNVQNRSDNTRGLTTSKTTQPAGLPENTPKPMFGVASATPTKVNPNKTAASAGGSAPPVTPAPNAVAVQSADKTAAVEATGVQNTARQSDDSKAHSAKYEKLKKIIQDNYEKRKQKLEEALNNASPEVRPAIRQAVAQSDLEHERALKNLEDTENAGNAQNSDNSGSSQDFNNTRNDRSNRD